MDDNPSELPPRTFAHMLLVNALILLVAVGGSAAVGLTVFARTDDVLMALFSVVIFAFSLAGVALLILLTTGRFKQLLEVFGQPKDLG
jgi:hypothetical protein